MVEHLVLDILNPNPCYVICCTNRSTINFDDVARYIRKGLHLTRNVASIHRSAFSITYFLYRHVNFDRDFNQKKNFTENFRQTTY